MSSMISDVKAASLPVYPATKELLFCFAACFFLLEEMPLSSELLVSENELTLVDISRCIDADLAVFRGFPPRDRQTAESISVSELLI